MPVTLSIVLCLIGMDPSAPGACRRPVYAEEEIHGLAYCAQRGQQLLIQELANNPGYTGRVRCSIGNRPPEQNAA